MVMPVMVAPLAPRAVGNELFRLFWSDELGGNCGGSR